MATDFAVFLHRFLTAHLAGLRGCSPNTVASYRDTFKLLIVFFRDGKSIPPEKLTLDYIDDAAITVHGSDRALPRYAPDTAQTTQSPARSQPPHR